MRSVLSAIVVTCASAANLGAQPSAAVAELPSMQVSAGRLPQESDEIPLTVDVLARDALRASPALTVDDTLKNVASFSLFRRSGSLTANPTSQGVSLRGIGPSGASRALVLLDGVPLNDPFGGWVAWSAVPLSALSRVEVVHGGAAGPWGNAALGGTIQLFSDTDDTWRIQSTVTLGDFQTRSGEIAAQTRAGGGLWRIAAGAFATDGVALVRQPGAVDRPADVRHNRASLTWRRRLAGGVGVQAGLRQFDEVRGNGTPLQANRSRATVASLGADGRMGDWSWTALGYAQRQAFDSYFSSVNATRMAETPASHQYDVPAAAAGAGVTMARSSPHGRTSAGVDARWVQGETREYYGFNTAGGFARERRAGGEQWLSGVFAQHEQVVGAAWRASASLRADVWSNTDGHRREWERASGSVSRNDHYAAQDGVEWSPRVGLVWRPTSVVRVRTALYQAFRLPTLNEYYRPFRVGNAVTEANPALRVETLDGGELGVDLGGPDLGGRVVAYENRFHDAVANVTVVRGPGTFPVFGTLPAGGVGREKRNLDTVRVRGVELAGFVRPMPALRLAADAVVSDTEVLTASAAPLLVGRSLAQVPRWVVTAGASWAFGPRLSFEARGRHVARQFEDDENTLTLAAATTMDVSLMWRLTDTQQVSVAVENVTATEVETGRSAEGVVSVGAPRWARLGWRCEW